MTSDKSSERFNEFYRELQGCDNHPNMTVEKCKCLKAWQAQEAYWSKKCEELENALKFYADPANYCCTIEVGSNGQLGNAPCPTLKDDGKKARESLSMKSTNKKD